MSPKLICFTVALIAVLAYVYPCLALEDTEQVGAATVTVTVDADSADGAVATYTVTEGVAGADCAARVYCAKAPAGKAGCKVAKVYAVGLGDEDSSRGWLGVQLAEVSEALAAHLPVADEGVMIVNVVEDSPAEKAGLAKHDIIVTVNGEAVSDGVGGLAKTIGGIEPGATMAVKVLRDGEAVNVNVTLGSRPEQKIGWVYRHGPDEVTHEVITQHGKILSKDEDGNWTVQLLGDLAEMDDLPEEIREALPSDDQISIKMYADEDERKSVSVVRIRDGETITVAQEDDGDIVVTRADEGVSTEATYADAEALMAADEEAYEIYEQVSEGSQVEIHIGAEDDNIFRLRQFGKGPHTLHLEGAREEWKKQLEEAMEESRGAIEEANRSVDEARKHFKFRMKEAPHFNWFGEDGENSFVFDISQARQTFRVNPDGEIEVTIRKDDTEVTRVFRDEADLERRDEELYEKYSKTTMED
ncbi:MAG: PDZ domain-containing protein [bacterium]|nr:PDZ domain-containing protein [bacterium]